VDVGWKKLPDVGSALFSNSKIIEVAWGRPIAPPASDRDGTDADFSGGRGASEGMRLAGRTSWPRTNTPPLRMGSMVRSAASIASTDRLMRVATATG